MEPKNNTGGRPPFGDLTNNNDKNNLGASTAYSEGLDPKERKRQRERERLRQKRAQMTDEQRQEQNKKRRDDYHLKKTLQATNNPAERRGYGQEGQACNKENMDPVRGEWLNVNNSSGNVAVNGDNASENDCDWLHRDDSYKLGSGWHDAQLCLGTVDDTMCDGRVQAPVSLENPPKYGSIIDFTDTPSKPMQA
ncbi:hypothetical protein ACP70R_009428 [Stipagrostis hirtigluma subsp. patula]